MKQLFLSIYLRMILLLACCLLSNWTSGQSIVEETEKKNPLSMIQLSVNVFSAQLSPPSFDSFQQNQTLSGSLRTLPADPLPVDTFQANQEYAGLHLAGLFANPFIKGERQRDKHFFLFALETGRSGSNLYQMTYTDTSILDYRFEGNVFRVTTGYHWIMNKVKRRLQLYTGLEVVHEFHISANVFERELAKSDLTWLGERKLFAPAPYHMYFNAPLGIRLRLVRNFALFAHLNLAVGYQKISAFRFTQRHSGIRMGCSFHI